MSVGSAAGMAWLIGAIFGVFAGLLLMSWLLPTLLMATLILLIALALNLPRTRFSHGAQAGFLFSSGTTAFVVLLTADLLIGPIGALVVGVMALGLWRTLQLAGPRQPA